MGNCAILPQCQFLAPIFSATAGKPHEAISFAQSCGWLERNQSGLTPNRERAEFEAKLESLGMATPW